jgi:hypothetical protein
MGTLRAPYGQRTGSVRAAYGQRTGSKKPASLVGRGLGSTNNK